MESACDGVTFVSIGTLPMSGLRGYCRRGGWGIYFLVLWRSSDGSLRFAGQNAERDLGRVKELWTLDDIDGAEDHAMGDAGDVVADVFESGEGRHAAEIGGSGSQPGVAVVLALGFRFAKGVIPGVDTAQDGGVFRSAVVGLLF